MEEIIDLTTSSPPSSPAVESKKCANSWCRTQINGRLKAKRCGPCLKKDAVRQQRRRVQKKAVEELVILGKRHRKDGASNTSSSKRTRYTPPPAPSRANSMTSENHTCIENPMGGDHEQDDDDDDGPIPLFVDRQDIFDSLKNEFKQKSVKFKGQFTEPDDPLISPRERVRQTMLDIWTATGYRFIVHDHRKRKNGHQTRFWCSQDTAHKQKARKHENPEKHRDNLGMARFPCRSKLTITCYTNPATPSQRIIEIHLEHHEKHVDYEDITMPPEVLQEIREGAENYTPVELAKKIQSKYPRISSAQVHNAWAHVSQAIWRRADDQLQSAKILLEEWHDDVDVFETPGLSEDIVILCWGMKKVAHELAKKVAEVAQDATYDTNASHLELYSILAEHDNAGYPLGYCLLSTASSVDQGKRIDALSEWTRHIRDKYSVNPRFVHTDKDMGEISMARRIWSEAKISLCLWHLDRAIKTRLSSSKLSTTPYHPNRAHAEFSFIDETFVPPGRPDPKEYEGGDHHDTNEASGTIADITNHPHHARAQANLATSLATSKENNPAPYKPATTIGVGGSLGGLAAGTIRIPSSQQGPHTRNRAGRAEEEKARLAIKVVDVEDDISKRVFCPLDYRQPILDMIKRHYHAHPSIPGDHHPSTAGVKQWAVKQVYEFCIKHDLKEAWAYLWENWYRKGRWELWARSVNDCIPILKTTMIVESHWRRIKKDFLHHFHCPRIDLLVWLLVKKLTPNYYFLLSKRLNDTGRDRFRASWRKKFKSLWRYLETKDIDEEAEAEVYRPDARKWICGCPAYVQNRFLVCKHLVQAVEPIPRNSRFFYEVKRNRTAPYWRHADLRVLGSNGEAGENPGEGDIPAPAEVPSDSEDDEVILADLPASHSRSVEEEYQGLMDKLTSFANALDFQKQFGDRRFLDTVKRACAPTLNLIDDCLTKERRMNSTRGGVPSTWQTGNAMFYRHRPSDSNS